MSKRGERSSISPDQSTAPEQLSVDQLKVELFDLEVPENYRKFFGTPYIELTDDYSQHLRSAIFDYAGAKKESYSIPYKCDAIPTTEIPNESLSEFGRFLKDKVKGGTVIDLGCGEGSFMEKYAIALGAKRYIGVDNALQCEVARKERDTEIYRVAMDMLGFVAQIKNEMGAVYYLGGIEPNARKIRIVEEYSSRLLNEIRRTMKVGDILILGNGTRGFIPEEIGFEQITFQHLAKYDKDMPKTYTTRVYKKAGEATRH